MTNIEYFFYILEMWLQNIYFTRSFFIIILLIYFEILNVRKHFGVTDRYTI